MGRHKKTHLGNLAKVVRKHSIRPLTSNEPTNITEFLPQIKIDLEKLSRKYENCVDCYGLVTDLSKILHCDNDNASRYAVFELNGKIYSIRISGHNANCDNYEDHAPNDFNLILVLEREAKPNRFNANENVVAEEYVYTNDRVRNIQNPFSKIILAIKRYLETGVYIDPLPQGTSYQHISPNNNAETQSTMIKNGLGNVVQSLQNRERQDDWIFPRPILESYAIYRKNSINMRKMRLNESQFNRLVSKCVKKAINEINSKKTLNVDAICQWAKQSADKLNNGDDACYFYLLGKSKCKTNEMFLVLGWGGGFDEAKPNEPYADGEYRVCCKLAYNWSASKCDYEFDWEMPYDEDNGDVDDTDGRYSDRYVRYLLNYWQKNYAC